VAAWLQANPHVPSTSPSRIVVDQQIETWFGIITRQSIPTAPSPPSQSWLKQIRDYIAHWNHPRHTVHLDRTADEILAKVQLVQTHIKKLVDTTQS